MPFFSFAWKSVLLEVVLAMPSRDAPECALLDDAWHFSPFNW